MYQDSAASKDVISLNVDNWAKGIYIVELKADGTNLLQKLVIQ